MKKLTVKNWIVLAVMAVLLAGMIVADCICGFWAKQITNLLCGTGLDFSGEDVEMATAESDKLINNLGDEGIVLLKNIGGEDSKGILPLAETNRKINLFGWGSSDGGFLRTGGGSGAAWEVPGKAVTLSKGLENAGFEVNRDLLDRYKAFKGGREWPKIIEPPASFYTPELIASAKEFSDTAVITITRYGSEGLEMPLVQTNADGVERHDRTFLQLSLEEENTIDVVTQNFDKVIVLLNTCNTMELGFLDNDKIDAALIVGMLGQSGVNAVGRILKGEVNPSAHTVDTYAYDHKSNPSYVNKRRDGDHIHYVEDIYIGYKWYETAYAEKITHTVNGTTYDYSTEEGYRSVVQYPFGYGLSYTSFEWNVDGARVIVGDTEEDLRESEVEITNKKASFEIDVSVTNVGNVAGKDVVQIYYSAPYDKLGPTGNGGIEKAALNLAAFAKTPMLEPGQTSPLTLTFDLYDMASYDCYDKNGNGATAFELDEGDYSITVRKDAHTVAPCENAELTFSLPNKINYKLDPKTKQIVKNRFTGETAYAGVPIDGSTAGEPITYLSRKDFAGTFPAVTAPNRYGSEVDKANSYVYDGFDKKYATAPTQGQTYDNPLLIWKRTDGSAPDADDLNGTSGVELVLNEELVLKLGRNYNAAEYDQLLNQLTTAELFNLVECSGYGNDAMVSIGKANNRDYDGPAGLRPIDGTLTGSMAAVWSGYPGSMNVAQTFNIALAFQMGRAVGNEATTTGISGWYAPAVNLHRSPYNGRYFEYFSEDGVLSGVLASYIIRGAASVNVYCYLKHFALSEMGINPRNLNVWCTEQALRETYLRPFEIAVKKGNANAVMTAFNRVGGTWAGGSKPLLRDILRTEWGFKGVVLTDWSTGDSYMNPKQGIRAGNDTWLNPNDASGAPLDHGNPVDINLARDAAHNMIYTISSTYCAYKDYVPSDGEFTASVGIRATNDVFAWWILLLVLMNIIVFGIIVWQVLMVFLPRKKKEKAKAAVAAAPEDKAAEEDSVREEGAIALAAASAAASDPFEETDETPTEEEPMLREVTGTRTPEPEPKSEPEPAPPVAVVPASAGETAELREKLERTEKKLDEVTAELALLKATVAALAEKQSAPKEETPKAKPEAKESKPTAAKSKKPSASGGNAKKPAAKSVSAKKSTPGKTKEKASESASSSEPTTVTEEISRLKKEVEKMKNKLG